MRNKILFPAFAFTLLLVLAADVRACGCGGGFLGNQPCSAYWRANIVFVGTPVEVGPPTPVEGSEGRFVTMRGRVTRVQVEEAFRGVMGTTVETTEEGSSCDYNFRVGERYFIYGSRNPADGRVYVNSCSATKTLDRAADDLAYARGVVRGEPTPSIVGYVSREVRRSAAEYRHNEPMANVRVVIEGNERRTETTTNARGFFSVFGLPAGRYRVRAETPSELEHVSYSRSGLDVQVVEGRCGGGGFTVTSLSGIRGRVVNSEGAPASQTKINLVAVDESGRETPFAERSVETYTNAEGEYAFDGIAPGRYLVAVNARNQPGSYDPPFPRAYHPGVREASGATAITVADGGHYEAGEFRLPPPLIERTIEGMVVWPDGRPAAHALLTLEFTEREWIETGSADAQGRFTFKIYDGFRYLVAAEVRREVQGVWRSTHSQAAEITSGEATEPVRLIISQPGFYETRYSRRRRNSPQ